MTPPEAATGRDRFRSTLAFLAAALVLSAVGPRNGEAQELAGVALDPSGEPLVGVTVILHRVGTAGGAMAGTDTTGANGEFRFALAPQDSSVYFAALRYQGQIYVGPATQAGGDPVTGYVLQVSPSSEVGAVGAALGNPRTPPPTQARPGSSPGRSGGDAGAIALVALLALAAAATFMYTAPRYRRRRKRETVLEVAKIENRLAAEAGTEEELSPEERQRLEARRARLKEQLAPRD